MLRNLILSPDPRTLPADPAAFVFGVQLLVGPADGPGEESFELTVCSPEWLDVRCRSGELVNGLHHVIVGQDTFDERILRDWLESHVHAVEAATWDRITSQLRLLGGWEFELPSLIAADEDVVRVVRTLWVALLCIAPTPCGKERL